MDLVAALWEIARHNGGVVTRDQAAAIGIADQRLTELCRRGVIARIARGVYIVGGVERAATDPLALTTAHKLALSFESSAAWLGADLPMAPAKTQVTGPRNRGQRADAYDGAELHRADLGSDDVIIVRGVAVTGPLRTALDIARTRPLDHAVAIVDALIRARQLFASQFIAAAGRASGPGAKQVRLVARLINPKSGSILESFTRVLMWRNNIPDPEPQFSFSHPVRGWVGYVDFAWPTFRAVLECDGYEYHATRVPFQNDRRRWTAISGAHWQLAVVTWFDVTCDPDYVVAAIHDMLEVSPGK